MRVALLHLIVMATVMGCQSAPSEPENNRSATREPAPAQPVVPAQARPVAYIDGQALTPTALLPGLYEAAGGEALADAVLDHAVAARLEDRGLTISPAMIEAERALLLGSLSDDPDTAVRLLGELREARGLGAVRFDAMLRRNAGLRLLTAEQVTVTEAALAQQHAMDYGPRYRVRLLVAATAAQANRLRERAAAGEAFADLAALHSIDPSAAQGGLLSPISPADPNYPQAIRTALPRLDAQPLSPVIALGDRFAVLRLEGKIDARDVPLDDVREQLTVVVRRRTQRVLMEQLARELLADAQVVVLDPTLKAAWERQRRALLSP